MSGYNHSLKARKLLREEILADRLYTINPSGDLNERFIRKCALVKLDMIYLIRLALLQGFEDGFKAMGNQLTKEYKRT